MLADRWWWSSATGVWSWLASRHASNSVPACVNSVGLAQQLFCGWVGRWAMIARAYADVNRVSPRLDSIEVEIMCLAQILDGTRGGRVGTWAV